MTRRSFPSSHAHNPSCFSLNLHFLSTERCNHTWVGREECTKAGGNGALVTLKFKKKKKKKKKKKNTLKIHLWWCHSSVIQ